MELPEFPSCRADLSRLALIPHALTPLILSVNDPNADHRDYRPIVCHNHRNSDPDLSSKIPL